MNEKLIPLEEWARRQYGEHAPNVDTLRRWARDAIIVPAPQKHGRSYYVSPDAKYMRPNAPERAQPRRRARLIERIDGTKTTQS